ncbi:MAG TPA: hypothetical protein DCM67_10350 [Propionibacteriaceae bacterium]|nr:hypothetical protein [Propionibacteriaceae bacterium]
MSDSAFRDRLTIRSLDDLVALVPYLLGFHPEQSLVVVVVSASGVQLTGRIDLADAVVPHRLADLVGRLSQRFPNADQWFLAYTADATAAWEVLQHCAELVGAVRLGRLLHVDADQWRADHLGGEFGQLGPNALATEAAVLGMAARASRDDLGTHLAGPGDDAVADLLTQCEAAEATARSLGPAQRKRLLRRLVRTAADSSDHVQLAVLIKDPVLQWEVLRGLERGDADAAVSRWSAVVAHCLTPYLAAPLGLLGVASWLAGDGATQNLCLERLDQLDPLAPLAALLDWINQTVLPPSTWSDHRATLIAAFADHSGLVGAGDAGPPGA